MQIRAGVVVHARKPTRRYRTAFVNFGFRRLAVASDVPRIALPTNRFASSSNRKSRQRGYRSSSIAIVTHVRPRNTVVDDSLGQVLLGLGHDGAGALTAAVVLVLVSPLACHTAGKRRKDGVRVCRESTTIQGWGQSNRNTNFKCNECAAAPA